MSFAQFTPGEWDWQDDIDGKILVSSNGEIILKAKPEILAYDQDLIKSSPELFRALEKAPEIEHNEYFLHFLMRHKKWIEEFKQPLIIKVTQ